jgi:hypothetical protein
MNGRRDRATLKVRLLPDVNGARGKTGKIAFLIHDGIKAVSI